MQLLGKKCYQINALIQSGSGILDSATNLISAQKSEKIVN